MPHGTTREIQILAHHYYVKDRSLYHNGTTDGVCAFHLKEMADYLDIDNTELLRDALIAFATHQGRGQHD